MPLPGVLRRLDNRLLSDMLLDIRSTGLINILLSADPLRLPVSRIAKSIDLEAAGPPLWDAQ